MRFTVLDEKISIPRLFGPTTTSTNCQSIEIIATPSIKKYTEDFLLEPPTRTLPKKRARNISKILLVVPISKPVPIKDTFGITENRDDTTIKNTVDRNAKIRGVFGIDISPSSSLAISQKIKDAHIPIEIRKPFDISKAIVVKGIKKIGTSTAVARYK